MISCRAYLFPESNLVKDSVLDLTTSRAGLFLVFFLFLVSLGVRDSLVSSYYLWLLRSSYRPKSAPINKVVSTLIA